MPSQESLLASPRLPRKMALAWILGRRRAEPGQIVCKTEFIFQPGNKINIPALLRVNVNSLNKPLAIYGLTLLYTVAKHFW